jgi:Gluconate 2-dehydrogenase subunit 3
MDAMLSRRDLVRALTAVAFTRLQLPAAEPGAPLFFTRDEFALLDALTDLLIPTDDHSPGAHEAGVAAYIDRTTAEAFRAEDKETWRKGLAAMDAFSRDMCHCAFLKASKQQQADMLTQLAAKEKDPKTEPEKFFTQLKQTAAFAYYSSSIGIHQETNYKGNVLLEQFVGYDAT